MRPPEATCGSHAATSHAHCRIVRLPTQGDVYNNCLFVSEFSLLLLFLLLLLTTCFIFNYYLCFFYALFVVAVAVAVALLLLLLYLFKIWLRLIIIFNFVSHRYVAQRGLSQVYFLSFSPCPLFTFRPRFLPQPPPSTHFMCISVFAPLRKYLLRITVALYTHTHTYCDCDCDCDSVCDLFVCLLFCPPITTPCPCPPFAPPCCYYCCCCWCCPPRASQWPFQL